MPTDDNFWKNKYKSSWPKSKERELMVAKKISDEAGQTAELVGLGAGSDTYLEGSAKSQGFDKGGADLHIVGTSIFIEVTGPLIPSIRETEDLWVRPDKIDQAESHSSSQETWVVHHLPFNDLIRVIKLDDLFFKRYKASAFNIGDHVIRGQKETYVEIPANDACVLPWSALIERLKNQKQRPS